MYISRSKTQKGVEQLVEPTDKPRQKKRLIHKGVLNGLIEYKSARKIWPLLELLAKIR